MAERLSATKLCLASLVLAVAIGSGIRLSNQKYYNQAREIRNRIDSSSQLSESEKKEVKAMFGSFHPWSLSKKQREYLKIPLEEKRKKIYEDYAPRN